MVLNKLIIKCTYILRAVVYSVFKLTLPRVNDNVKVSEETLSVNKNWPNNTRVFHISPTWLHTFLLKLVDRNQGYYFKIKTKFDLRVLHGMKNYGSN